MRNKELSSSVLNLSNSVGFQFFSPVEKDNTTTVDQLKNESQTFRWD